MRYRGYGRCLRPASERKWPPLRHEPAPQARPELPGQLCSSGFFQGTKPRSPSGAARLSFLQVANVKRSKQEGPKHLAGVRPLFCAVSAAAGALEGNSGAGGELTLRPEPPCDSYHFAPLQLQDNSLSHSDQQRNLTGYLVEALYLISSYITWQGSKTSNGYCR